MAGWGFAGRDRRLRLTWTQIASTQPPAHADVSAKCTGVSEVAHTLSHPLSDPGFLWPALDVQAICFHFESAQIPSMQRTSRPMSVNVCLDSGFSKRAEGIRYLSSSNGT